MWHVFLFSPLHMISLNGIQLHHFLSELTDLVDIIEFTCDLISVYTQLLYENTKRL